jgi:predicted small metal-binding protein
MAKVLRCDAIFLGCGHVVRAESEEELLRLAAEHAREVHGVIEIDEAMASKVRAAITNE